MNERNKLSFDPMKIKFEDMDSDILCFIKQVMHKGHWCF